MPGFSMLSSGRYAFAEAQPAARRLDYHEPPRSKWQYAIEKRVTTLAGESPAHFIDFHVWRAWHTPYSRHLRGRVETGDHIAGGTRADCDRVDRISPNTKTVGIDGDSRARRKAHQNPVRSELKIDGRPGDFRVARR